MKGRGNVQGLPPIIQGLYYGMTGRWPLLSLGTFERVTGPKTDL
jgi:hypothetical protein